MPIGRCDPRLLQLPHLELVEVEKVAAEQLAPQAAEVGAESDVIGELIEQRHLHEDRLAPAVPVERDEMARRRRATASVLHDRALERMHELESLAPPVSDEPPHRIELFQ